MKYSSIKNAATRGQFTLKVTRLTANIAQPLPVALFGTSAYQAGYQSEISAPAGLTLTVVGGTANAAAGYANVDFSWTDGANTDIVRVQCPTVQYPVLLNALNTDLLEYSSIKLFLSGASDQSQFNNSLYFKTTNLFGSRSEQNIEPASAIETTQLQTNQVDLLVNGTLDKESSIVTDMNAEAGLSYGITFFFNRFIKYNAAALLGG